MGAADELRGNRLQACQQGLRRGHNVLGTRALAQLHFEFQ